MSALTAPKCNKYLSKIHYMHSQISVMNLHLYVVAMCVDPFSLAMLIGFVHAVEQENLIPALTRVVFKTMVLRPRSGLSHEGFRKTAVPPN